MDGPSVERNVYQLFKNQRGFQALGVDVWDGSASDVKRYFVDLTGTSYPVLLKGGLVGSQYGLDRDTYMVVDQEGVVRYLSPGVLGQRYNESVLVSTIQSLLVPGYSQSSSSLSSGSVNVGSSGTQTFTVSNTGTAALTVSGITVSGTDAAQFTVSPTSFTIQAGDAAQTVTVTFTPTGGPGSRSATLSIAHNASGSSSAILLTGTALTPVLSLPQSALSFGDALVGKIAPLNLFVENTGTASLSISGMALSGTDAGQFGFTSVASTVLPGQRAQVAVVAFAPKSAGSKSAALSIVHNASGSPSIVALIGNGTLPPPPQILVNELKFGDVDVGKSKILTLTISNTGTGDLSITGISSDNGRFSISESTFTLSADSGKDITVTFLPSAAETQTGKLSIVHNGTGSPTTVALTGRGVTSAIALSTTSLPFGDVQVGQSRSLAFTVGNAGNAALRVSSIARAGADSAQFTVGPATFTINPADSIRVTVTFTPSSVGSKSASLSVAHNASGSPSSVALSGAGITSIAAPSGLTATADNNQVSLTWRPNAESALSYYIIYRSGTASALGDSVGKVDKPGTTFRDTGLGTGMYYYRIKAVDAVGNRSRESNQASATFAPVISLSSIALSFSNVSVESSGALTVTVSNTGTAALMVTSMSRADADSAQFTVSPTSFTINAGDSVKVTVTFAPTSTGPKSAMLSIAHNAIGSPATVRLSGVGLKPSVAYRPDRLSFGNVAMGAAVERPITLYNLGNDTLRVEALKVALSTGSGKEFTVTASRPNPIIAPGDSQIVAVSFRPSIPGDLTGSLTASSNDPNNRTLSISVSGVGVPLALSVDFNPADMDQKLTTAGGVRPGKKIPVQVFIEEAPQIRGFTVRIAFDPRKVAFVSGSFAAGPLVPGLIGLADVKKDYVEVGGVALGGGTGGGSGLLGTMMFEALQGFDEETTLRIPFVVWDRVPGGRQTIQTDIQFRFIGAGGPPTPDFNGDGKADFDDFFLFATAFGQQAKGENAKFDLDGDGEIGFGDFFLFAGAFGKPAP